MGKYVVGLGEALFDRFRKEDGSVEAKLGGAPANFAYYASQFGQKGLADAQLFRSLGDVFRFRCCAEVSKIPQFHVFSTPFTIHNYTAL